MNRVYILPQRPSTICVFFAHAHVGYMFSVPGRNLYTAIIKPSHLNIPWNYFLIWWPAYFALMVFPCPTFFKCLPLFKRGIFPLDISRSVYPVRSFKGGVEETSMWWWRLKTKKKVNFLVLDFADWRGKSISSFSSDFADKGVNLNRRPSPPFENNEEMFFRP